MQPPFPELAASGLLLKTHWLTVAVPALSIAPPWPAKLLPPPPVRVRLRNATVVFAGTKNRRKFPFAPPPLMVIPLERALASMAMLVSGVMPVPVLPSGIVLPLSPGAKVMVVVMS